MPTGHTRELSVDATTTTAICTADTSKNPFQVTLSLIVTGVVDISVEYLVNPPDSAVLVYKPHTDLTNKTANAVGTLISPVYGYKLIQNSGAGSAKLHILQTGSH